MKILKNVLLAPFTTFKIGGPAEYFCLVKTTADLIKTVDYAYSRQLKLYIFGKGSNILIPDSGLKGLVIINRTGRIKILNNNQAELDSGVFLPKAALYLIKHGLIGLEKFAGIPATIGGATAVRMHGVGVKWSDFIVSVKKYREVILSVIIQLHSGDPVAAETEFKRIQLAKRHQPQHSAGCVFINPNGESAGAIIDKKLHLKGITIGQAQIAPEHANFIKNLGKASAADVLALIKLIETTAWKKLKLKFKREVIVYESINH